MDDPMPTHAAATSTTRKEGAKARSTSPTSVKPIRFQATVGNIRFPINDKRTYAFVSDKWALNNKVTLNLGVRHDYSDMTPQKDAFAPRLGVVYAPDAKTAIRAAFGKFYEFASTAVLQNLLAGQVISSTTNFDSGQDLAADSGRVPAHPCLQPTGNAGMAVINATCRAMLNSARAGLENGSFVNPEPVLPGNRKIGFLYQYNVGVERQIMANMAVTVDFIQSYGRDQTNRIDINEPRLLANGTIGRPGPDVFDPDGTRIPAQARNTAFRRVLEYTTSSLFNNDYRAVEMSVDRRFANRWSGRASWTISRARDVSATPIGNADIVQRRVNDDLNPRLDYGLTSFNNTHAFTAGGNWSAWRGLGIGATFRYYSGNPVNETVGVDRNGDADAANFDRPMAGRDDATLPIVSRLDANGVAMRNELDGSDKMLLDLRVQYVLESARAADLWIVLGDLQRHEPRQLRQPDREPPQQRLPPVGRRRRCALDAGRIPFHVLTTERAAAAGSYLQSPRSDDATT